MVASTGVRPRASALHCSMRLEFERVGGDVGHVELGQHLLGRARVVVGGAAHEREAGERDHGVHRRHAVLA